MSRITKKKKARKKIKSSIIIPETPQTLKMDFHKVFGETVRNNSYSGILKEISDRISESIDNEEIFIKANDEAPIDPIEHDELLLELRHPSCGSVIVDTESGRVQIDEPVYVGHPNCFDSEIVTPEREITDDQLRKGVRKTANKISKDKLKFEEKKQPRKMKEHKEIYTDVCPMCDYETKITKEITPVIIMVRNEPIRVRQHTSCCDHCGETWSNTNDHDHLAEGYTIYVKRKNPFYRKFKKIEFDDGTMSATMSAKVCLECLIEYNFRDKMPLQMVEEVKCFIKGCEKVARYKIDFGKM